MMKGRLPSAVLRFHRRHLWAALPCYLAAATTGTFVFQWFASPLGPAFPPAGCPGGTFWPGSEPNARAVRGGVSGGSAGDSSADGVVLALGLPFSAYGLVEILYRWKTQALSGWTIFPLVTLLHPLLPLFAAHSPAVTTFWCQVSPLPVAVQIQFFFSSFQQFALLPWVFWKKALWVIGFNIVGVVVIALLNQPSWEGFAWQSFAVSALALVVFEGYVLWRDFSLHHDPSRPDYQSLNARTMQFEHHPRAFFVVFVLVGVLYFVSFQVGAIRELTTLRSAAEEDVPIAGLSDPGAVDNYCVLDSNVLYLMLLAWIATLALNSQWMRDSIVTATAVESVSELRERLPLLAHVPPSSRGIDEESDDQLPAISRQDLREGQLIGQGAYGAVYSCKVVRGPRKGARYAIKKLMLRGTSPKVRAELIASLKREIDLLKDLRHERLVLYIGAIVEGETISLLMDQFDDSLAGVISKRTDAADELRDVGLRTGGLDWIPPLVICRWLYQIADGVAYLHANSVAHGDLKPQNVLVELRGYNEVAGVYLCDFGVSKKYAEVTGSDERPQTLTMRGTPGYAAPEALREGGDQGKPYDPFAADMFGVGAIAFFILTGGAPPLGGDPVALLAALRKGLVARYHARGKEALDDARVGEVLAVDNTDELGTLASTTWSCFFSPNDRPSSEHLRVVMQCFVPLE